MKHQTDKFSILFLICLTILFIIIASAYVFDINTQEPEKQSQLMRFNSDQELIQALEKARKNQNYARKGLMLESATMLEDSGTDGGGPDLDYSETNIQVQGVDEADIIKTDGNYIYLVSNRNLIIAKSYPAEQAEILSTTHLNTFNSKEIFLHKNRLLIFGSETYHSLTANNIQPDPKHTVSVKLYDITNKHNPELLKTISIEGSYLTSRKIDKNVYFVINSYPRYWNKGSRPLCKEIVPSYLERIESEKSPGFQPIAKCIDIGYVMPIQAENFITIASLDMSNENKNLEKETILGSGQNVYASRENLYIAQTSWPAYGIMERIVPNYDEKTIISKFSLNNGKIKFQAKGEVRGHILNQFSMDEYDSNFRIATTHGNLQSQENKSSNNIYVLNSNMSVIGKLEDLAPGEKIYSVRFMGQKVYLVTFKKVDPLFVIDLSDPFNPNVLGKLKIPGYSDYLHPYDDNHIIGIGKDTVEAEESNTFIRQTDFAWYQGIKMAIFNVSDVENPIEMHKVIIGDRGTESEALRNHKAFLFDREKNLLILPISLAEIKGEKTRDNQFGEHVFQGAYVYNLTLENGFDLRGRITHYDNNEVFKKSGFYFNSDSAIKRSLYIEEVLYTLSNQKLQLNNLENLEKLKVLELK